MSGGIAAQRTQYSDPGPRSPDVKPPDSSTSLIPDERIASKVLLIRGIKVMLDRDLAELYGVEPKRLNEQVTRNLERFPEDFMFRLTKDEFGYLRSQTATLEGRGKHPKYLPRVFTE